MNRTWNFCFPMRRGICVTVLRFTKIEVTEIVPYKKNRKAGGTVGYGQRLGKYLVL